MLECDFGVMEVVNIIVEVVQGQNEYELYFFFEKSEVDLNEKDQMGRIVLFYVVCRGNLEIIKLLLENGVDVMVFDKNGNMFLYLSGYCEIIDLFVFYGVDVNVR